VGESGVRDWRKAKANLLSYLQREVANPMVVARPKRQTWKRR